MIKAVLFDFDGVVVRSEPLHMRSFMEILSPYGVDVPEERWYREFAGTGSRSIFERLSKEFGIREPIDALVERRKKLYEGYVEAGLLSMTSGVEDFLKALRSRGIKTAIVSGSHRTNVAAALSIFKLGGYFDTIVSGDDVESRKPEPGPFLHAAQRLACAPADCLAIEDSVAGCESARRAGMRLVFIRPPIRVGVGAYELAIDDFTGKDYDALMTMLG